MPPSPLRAAAGTAPIAIATATTTTPRPTTPRPPSTPGAASSAPSLPSPVSVSHSFSLSLGLGRLGMLSASPLRAFGSVSGSGVSQLSDLPGSLDGDGLDDSDSLFCDDRDDRSVVDSDLEESRDVLVDRLHDLVRHLTTARRHRRRGGGVVCDEQTLRLLHARVDAMEAVLAAAEAGVPAPAAAEEEEEEEKEKEPPEEQPDPPERPELPHARSPSLAPIVASACDALADNLEAVLASLRDRGAALEVGGPSASASRVPLISQHVQAVLLGQLAAATERIVELEAAAKAETRTMSMTTTTATTATTTADRLEQLASEATFLRLQLRGIEARCRAYVPVHADPELDESIANWKADWAALQARVTDETQRTGGNVGDSYGGYKRYDDDDDDDYKH